MQLYLEDSRIFCWMSRWRKTILQWIRADQSVIFKGIHRIVFFPKYLGLVIITTIGTHSFLKIIGEKGISEFEVWLKICFSGIGGLLILSNLEWKEILEGSWILKKLRYYCSL